jgi:hypothetical protein
MLADGRYKRAGNLKPGDKLMTVRVNEKSVAHTYAVKPVCSVVKRALNPGDDVLTLKHDAYHSLTSLVPSSRASPSILVWDHDQMRGRWCSTESIGASYPWSSECQSIILPPSGIESHVVETSLLSYELGYVYGAYMRVGSLRSFPQCVFVYDVHSSSTSVEELKRCVSEHFRAQPVTRMRGHLVQLTYHSQSMYNALSTCSSASARGIKYLSHVHGYGKAFNLGLAKGIITSGYAGLPRSDPSVTETLYVASLAAGLPISHRHTFETAKDGTLQYTSYGRVVSYEKVVSAKSDTSVIETVIMDEDETYALIADNMLLNFDDAH